MTNHQAARKKTLRLIIHGNVQGVFFRDSMRSEAQSLAVTGWVRNRKNGTVEAAVYGDAAALEAIVLWARRGPEHAHVERVEIKPDSGSYTSFEIIA
ncbi:MAG: acylphosphatase [Gallionella sp.]|nr:acylphosphatase [Gallionella sp.]